MNMFQPLFTKFADILLSSRAHPFLKCHSQIQNYSKDMGIFWNKETNINVRHLLEKNWRTHESNEMIVQFFLEQDGNSYLVEEWSLIHSIQNQLTAKRNNTLLKQMTIWLRSAIAMMTITTIFQDEMIIKQYKVSHSLLFYNKNTKKRSDWIDDSKLQVKKITTKFLNQINFQLTVAQQGSLSTVLYERFNRVDSPIFSRCRFHSEQIYERDSFHRTRTMDSDLWDFQHQKNTQPSSSGNLNRSFVSVYSKKDEVELLLTPEEAALKLQDMNMDDDYEINMMTTDTTEKEMFISQIMVTNKLSSEEKFQQQQLLSSLRCVHNRCKNRRIRSIQISKLVSFYRQMQ